MCPSHTSKILKQLLDLPATQLWTHSETVVRHFRDTLDPLVPSYVQGEARSAAESYIQPGQLHGAQHFGEQKIYDNVFCVTTLLDKFTCIGNVCQCLPTTEIQNFHLTAIIDHLNSGFLQ